MNKELIKKFRFEAAEHANNIKPLGITKWNEIRDEKFAELIVRECAKVAGQEQAYNERHEIPVNIEHSVLEQFGVE